MPVPPLLLPPPRRRQGEEIAPPCGKRHLEEGTDRHRAEVKAYCGAGPQLRPSAASRFPITSMYGIFCSCASRILACIRSRRSLTSMRSPPSVRRLATSLRVVDLLVSDRDDRRLHGSQPERKGPGVVLDQAADEALHRAEKGAVDHGRCRSPSSPM